MIIVRFSVPRLPSCQSSSSVESEQWRWCRWSGHGSHSAGSAMMWERETHYPTITCSSFLRCVASALLCCCAGRRALPQRRPGEGGHRRLHGGRRVEQGQEGGQGAGPQAHTYTRSDTQWQSNCRCFLVYLTRHHSDVQVRGLRGPEI